LYRFRVIASYLSKVADFNLPHMHLAPPWGDPVRISLRSLASEGWSPWAMCGVACLILCLTVLIQYRRVTDRRTHDEG